MSLLADRLSAYPSESDCALVASAVARVLHVINGEHYAGAERVQDLLALALPATGFQVGFVCLKPDRFPAVRQARHVPLYELPMRNRLDLSPARKLAAIIRRERYALVHTHTPRTALIGSVAAAIARVPVVHHLHSPTAVDTTHRWRNWINASAERLSLARISGIIAVSNSIADYARRLGVSAKRITVVHNGVPTRGPLASRPDPAEPWKLGVVGLFRPRKGLEILIETLARIRAEGSSVRLRAVGNFESKEYEAEVHSLARRMGVAEVIDWRGFVSNVDGELAAMDLLVLPSLFGEGLPMVLLEAMAAGVPTVATRVEGVLEALRHGVDGRVVEPGDAAALAAAVMRVLGSKNDWRTLRASAHQRQAESFSAESMASGVAAVYRRVVDGK